MTSFKYTNMMLNRLIAAKDTSDFGLIHNITGNANDLGGGHEFKFRAPDGTVLLVQVKRYA